MRPLASISSNPAALFLIQSLIASSAICKKMVPAISPDEFLKSQKPKRQIKPEQFIGYKSANIVEKHSVNNDRGFIIEQCKREQLLSIS